MTDSPEKHALRAAAQSWAMPEPAAARRDAELLAARVLGLAGFQAARAILLYWPMSPREMDVAPIARAALTLGKRVCIPKIEWGSRQMEPAALEAWEESQIVRNSKGVPVPNPGLPNVKIEDLGMVIVPGIAFDSRGGRLGRGGGFYDRFLARAGLAAKRVGVAFDAQIIAGVPMDRHDVCMDAVLTPTRTWMVG